MLRPYRIVDESEADITYEYNSMFTWLLYSALLLSVIGYLVHIQIMTIVGSVGIVAVLVFKVSAGKKISSTIHAAMNSGSVEISGNKSSLKNPLRIKVPKCRD